MGLTAFDHSLIIPWQEAIDKTGFSPSPLVGPEYAGTKNMFWGKTFIFREGDLFIPLAKAQTRHFRVISSDIYTGVRINSLLGVTTLDDKIFEALPKLPSRSLIELHLPIDLYNQHKSQFHSCKFFPSGIYVHHQIALPASHDEWFSRPGVRRQNIRKAQQSGVRIAIGGVELLKSLYEMYLHSANKWKSEGIAGEHYSFERFQRIYSVPGGRAKIALASHDGRVIAAVLFCHYQQTGAYLMGGLDLNYQEMRPNNLLHSEIIRHLIEHKIVLYNLGFSLGLENLERFKESLGGTRHKTVILCRHRFPRLKKLLQRSTVKVDD